MKRIGLLSDTHSDFPERILDYFKDVDEIWHAGDIGSIEVTDRIAKFKPLRAVYGNIDDHIIRLQYPEFLSFELEGVNVLITHIAGKPGKYSTNSLPLIEKFRPKLFICGHSHILLVQNDPRFDMLWLNPGACGNKGFHKQKTLLRFELENGRIQNLEAIDLGKRAELNNSN